MARRNTGKRNRPTKPAAAPATTDTDAPRPLIPVLVVAGLLAYLILFYRVPLPSLGTDDAGNPAWDRLRVLLLPLDDPAQLLRDWLGIDPLVGLAERLPILFFAALIVSLSAALGYCLLLLIRAETGLTQPELVLFSLAVGLGAASLYTLLVGLAGALATPIPFAMATAVAVALAARLHARRGLRAAKTDSETATTNSTLPRNPDSESFAPLDRRLALLAIPVVVLILLGAMLPPVEFDVREYHLQVPKEFYQQHRVTFLPHNVYGNMALGTEMLSLLAMVVVDDWYFGALVGKTIIASFAIFTAAALYLFGQRFLTPAAGLIAALTFLSVPWIIRVSTLGLVEAASAFYLLLTVYALLLAFTGPPAHRTARLLLTGFLAGAAVSTKYPAALFVALPALLVVAVTAWRTSSNQTTPNQSPFLHSAKLTAFFLIGLAIGCGPWFAKNALLTGNPTYPLLYEFFDGVTRTAEKNAQWQQAHSPPNFALSDLATRARAILLTSNWHSAALVPLAALAFVRLRHRRAACSLAAAFLFVLATWWLFTHRIDRFWVPALPLLALLAGLGATWSAARWWRVTLVSFLLFTTVANLVFSAVGTLGDNRYLDPLDFLRADPMRVPPWIAHLNDEIPSSSKVLAVGDAAVFDVEIPVLYNTVFDDSLLEQLITAGDSTELRPPDEIRAALAAAGVSHLYVHWGEIDRYRQPGNYGFPDFVTPALFTRLTEQGVLSPQAQTFADGRVQIFTVAPPP